MHRDDKVKLFLALLLLATGMAGCSVSIPSLSTPLSEPPAAAPTEEAQIGLGHEYVWARKDGQRMATNPALQKQGEADRRACERASTPNGQLETAAFFSCMDQKGYDRRERPK